MIGSYDVLSNFSSKLTPKESQSLAEKFVAYWDENKEFLSISSPIESLSIGHEVSSRFHAISKVLAHVVIPNLSLDTSSEVIEKTHVMLNEMESRGLFCSTAKTSLLCLCPSKYKEISTTLKKQFSNRDRSCASNAAMGIVLFLCMKKRLGLKIDHAPIVRLMTGCVRDRLLPVLAPAMLYLRYIFREMPEYIGEQGHEDILLGLDYLVAESLPQNSKSHIPLSDRLECRKNAMMLAYALQKYIFVKSKTIPQSIRDWKNISESNNEYWVVKNEWKTEDDANDTDCRA